MRATFFRCVSTAVLAVVASSAALAQEPSPTVVANWDLMILLDESGSVNGTAWAQERQFARDLVNSLEFGPLRVAASVGAFGTTARTFIDMSENRSSVISAINFFNMPAGGSTCQTCAFELASAQFAANGRAGRPRVTIFVTDGLNNVRASEFSTALAQLQATSAIFAVGIGTNTIVDQIASDLPGIQTAFFANDFTGFDGLVNPMFSNLALYADSLNAPPVAAIPEPETYAMLLAGLAMLGFEARRRRRLLHTT